MAQNDINIKVKVDASQAEQQTDNYKKRLKELRDEMTQLQLAGKENTAQYAEAAKELANITDAMGDTAAMARVLSDDFFNQRVAMEGLGVATNVFSGLTQAIALCGGENEKLNKVIGKLQATMNLANSVMNISKALNKDSALMIALRTKALKVDTSEIKSNAAAENAGAVATKGFAAAEVAATGAAKGLTVGVKAVGVAIKAIPIIGWIATAISLMTSLIGLITDANDEEERGIDIKNQEQDALNNITTEHEKILKNIVEQGVQMRKNIKLLKNQSEDNIEYLDTYDQLAKSTGLTVDYLKSRNEAELTSIQQTYELKEQQEAHLAEVKELAETQENWNGAIEASEAALEKTNKKINEIRQNQLDWQKSENAGKEADKALQAYLKRVEEEYKKTVATIKTTYFDVLNDENTSFTEKYQTSKKQEGELIDAEIEKYTKINNAIDKNSAQYAENILKLKELTLKRENLYAVTEASEEEEVDYDAIVDNLTETYKNQSNVLENDVVPAIDLFKDKLAEADEQAEQNAENLQKLAEKEKLIYQKKWEVAEGFINSYNSLVSASMESELSMLEGNEEEQKKVRKKYAKAEFIGQIASIAASASKAVMETWEAYAKYDFIGPGLAAAQSAIILADAAAQTISAQSAMNRAMTGYAARGAFVKGRSHAEGGELYELEGGEAVLNKQAMSVPAFRALASAMNQSTGGVAFDNISASSPMSNKSLISANVSEDTVQRIVQDTISGITSIPVVVTEAAITEAQRNVNVTTSRSRF